VIAARHRASSAPPPRDEGVRGASSADAPPLPRELQVEVTGACNLRCRMCLVRYRAPLGRRRASLDLATFRDLVDALPDLERITLQGLGEPLLAPDLMVMIAYAAARGIRVGFNTNATLLTRARSRALIASGLDWLHVSVDGATAQTYESIRDGASFATVCTNVAALTGEVRASGGTRPTVSLVFVAMQRNVHELPDLVRLAATLGIARVRVQNLSHSFGDVQGDDEYREIRSDTLAQALWTPERRSAAARVFAQAQDVAREVGVTLRLPHLEEPAVGREAGARGCDWPWRSAYVRHDGRVQPCCMLMGEDRAIQGSLADADFATIWRATPYAQFRAALRTGEPPEPCRGCALYRGVF
jgi:radical SAM protein with 4Fe4S-binding SPASM domain